MKLTCIIAVILSATFAALPAQAEIHYMLARDTATGVTHMHLMDDDDQILASASWSGALPLGVSPTSEARYFPAVLIAQLRDDAVNRGRTSEAAFAWSLKHLGAVADLRTVDIARDIMVTFESGGTETIRWCGNKLSHDLKCTETCSSGGGIPACNGCWCSGEITRPVKPAPRERGSLQVAQ